MKSRLLAFWLFNFLVFSGNIFGQSKFTPYIGTSFSANYSSIRITEIDKIPNSSYNLQLNFSGTWSRTAPGFGLCGGIVFNDRLDIGLGYYYHSVASKVSFTQATSEYSWYHGTYITFAQEYIRLPISTTVFFGKKRRLGVNLSASASFLLRGRMVGLVGFSGYSSSHTVVNKDYSNSMSRVNFTPTLGVAYKLRLGKSFSFTPSANFSYDLIHLGVYKADSQYGGSIYNYHNLNWDLSVKLAILLGAKQASSNNE